MTPAGALLLVAGALAPGFRFRLDSVDAARYANPGQSPAQGVSVVFRTSEIDRTRVDLFVRAGDRLPRWKWTDGALVATGRTTLRAPAGVTALLTLRDPSGPGYRLDGPFLWPDAPATREVHSRLARAVGGSSRFASPPYDLRLTVGDSRADPLCEVDGENRWQCAGLPRTFSGRVVSCRNGAIAAAGDVRPGSPFETVMRPVSFAALLRIEVAEPAPDRPPPVVRVLGRRAPEASVLRPDPRWRISDLGDGFIWLETDSDSPEGRIEVRATGYATKRFDLRPQEVRCADPVPVLLADATTLRGSVTDPKESPVAAALVLVRSGSRDEEKTVLGDGETDSNGEFEISGVERGEHRIRACHGEHGCTEELALSDTPVILRLPGRGAFTGRVLSMSGVPQAGVIVRIVPTAETWTSAGDRLSRLPLESESGPDGRFRISAAENGDYLVEVRSLSSGVARAAVRRTEFSPAVTDLGDVRLPEAIVFTARVPGCSSGWLHLSGPLGGETSLPALARFRLDGEGSASVRLPEGGAWTTWAICSGRVEWIEPAILPDAAGLGGQEVRFERAVDRSSAGRD